MPMPMLLAASHHYHHHHHHYHHHHHHRDDYKAAQGNHASIISPKAQPSSSLIVVHTHIRAFTSSHLPILMGKKLEQVESDLWPTEA